MKRREFIALIGNAAIMRSPGAGAEQAARVWRIGFLGSSPAESLNERGEPGGSRFDALRAGMREHGHVEGKDFIIEWRVPERAERCRELAAELVRLKVDIIIAVGWPAVEAAQAATSTIPIVIGYLSDPVALGIVQGLARPAGNVTGLSSSMTDIIPKHLELLMTAVPKLSRVAALLNPTNPTGPLLLRQLQASADMAGITPVPVEARSAEEIIRGFTDMARERIEAVIVVIDPVFTTQRHQIAELALKHSLPSIYGINEYAAAGGLMSYGDNLSVFYRRTAAYVDRIMKGAKPGDLPIEQPTAFNLVVNKKTANALRIKIPPELLVRADEVIE